ncbi:T6SS effector BTH_I2691 family protein [Holophaga foetida]|uniref:T6SS effector BTH_I2691 family protein n=1 Tax=Holophaga foetida TaxID=35839 RepID=UPI0002471D0A|nr:T6SS effector BTH_I2691 family protein [Holophaga foetida]
MVDHYLGTHSSNLVRGSVKDLHWSKPVPIFPVRYALGDDGSRTPPLSGSFCVTSVKPSPGTHYTLRRPRGGYLYVFNEKSQFWNIFLVNPWGQLSPVDRNDQDHRNLGYTQNGLVLAPDDSVLWFCFTNHLLDKSILSQAAHKQDFRSKFMRCVKPLAPGPHTGALKDVETHVADLARGVRPEAFWFSAFPFAKQKVDQLESEVSKDCLQRGLILALDDPTGIAMDTRAMMAQRYNNFVSEPERARRNASYQAVLDIRASVQSFGEKEYLQRQKPQDSLYGLMAKARAVVQEDGRMLDDFNKNVQNAIEQARWKAWEPYHYKVNWDAMGKWPSQLEQQLNEHKDKVLIPLAETHARWMQSPELQAVFRYHYPSGVADTGGHYAGLLRLCIEGTQAYKPCADLYLKWLEDDAFRSCGILARGLLSNHSPLLNEIRNAPFSSGVSFNDFAIKGSLPVITQAVDALGGAAGDSMKALAKELIGPLTELTKKAAEEDRGRLALSALAAIEKKQLRLLTFRNTGLSDVLESITESVRRVNPSIKQGQARCQIAGFLGQDPRVYNARKPTKWVVVLNEEELRLHGINPGSEGLLTLDRLTETPANRWNFFKTSTGRFSALMLACQSASLVASIRDFNSAPVQQNIDVLTQLSAGILAWSSSVATTVYSVVSPNVALGIIESNAFKTFRYMGVAAGVLNGLVDIYKGWQALTQKDYKTMGCYWFSAASGIGSSILLGTTWLSGAWVPIVGWVLLAVFIGIQLYLATRSGPLHDWLEKCAFGIRPGFHTADAERAFLKTAVSGV